MRHCRCRSWSIALIAFWLLSASCANRSGEPTILDTRGPVVLDIDVIIAFNADRSNWSGSVTGVWGDATSKMGEDVYGGYLVLFQEGDQVLGVSTTGNSIWLGRLTDGVLRADYVVDEGRGELRLELLSDGARLEGTWVSGTDEGTYAAYRQADIDKQYLIGHLRERLGDKVQIVE